jgi:hypothetical protein
MNSAFKAVIFVIFATSIQGCAGVLTSTSESVNLTNAVPSETRGYFVKADLKTAPTTKENIITYWGTPDKVTMRNSDEILEYNVGSSYWRGITPVFIIPIPLLIPGGQDKITLVFKEEKLTEVVLQSKAEGEHLCGITFFGPGGPTGPGCLSQTENPLNKYIKTGRQCGTR